MDQCVHPLPLSGSCDQHRDKRRLGHCSTHQVGGGGGGCLRRLEVVDVACVQIVTNDGHSQCTHVTCHLTS